MPRTAVIARVVPRPALGAWPQNLSLRPIANVQMGKRPNGTPFIYMGAGWRRAYAPALGDDYSDQLACIKLANASPWVAQIDAEISRINTSWKPTGYYTPAEVQSLINVLTNEAAAAGDALASAPRSTRDAEQMIAQAFDDLVNKFQVRSRLYQQDLANAAAAGINVIDAPALKDWVVSSMRAISDAYTTAVVMYCRQSTLESLLSKAYGAIAAIGRVVWSVVGIAYKVVRDAALAVYHAADAAWSFAKWIAKWGPTIAIGTGVYFGYRHFVANKR